MRRLFNQLVGTVTEFIEQRDDLIMIVPCGDSDVPLLMKAMRDLDRESGSDLFLLFANDFSEPDTFLDDLVSALSQEHRLANDAAPEDAKLAPIPHDILDANRPSAERLEAAMRYAHSLIDARRGQHFVWGMGPGAIADSDGYLRLLEGLVPRPDIRAWMRGARIIARAPADFSLAASPLASTPRVRVAPFTIPPDAHEKELAADADDPKLPLADRMQAEVQLGYIDYAHGRYAQAVDRFLNSLAFFQWAGVPVLEGLVICGLGDIARRQQNMKEALHWYECALVPASKDGNPILMSTIVQHLAAIAFQEERFADAEERYGELATLKRAMVDEDGLAEALEWQGLSHEHQRAYDRAVLCWYEGALICKSFEMSERLPRVLAHLRRAYQALDMRDELDRFDAEWSA